MVILPRLAEGFSVRMPQQCSPEQPTKHPGGRVHARLDVGHPWNRLKVADELGRLRPRRPGVDRLAAPLQQMQLVKGLQAERLLALDISNLCLKLSNLICNDRIC